MNGKDLWNALGEIDPKYIQEAEELPKRTHSLRRGMQGMAACLAIVLLSTAIMAPSLLYPSWSGWSGIGELMPEHQQWLGGLLDGAPQQTEISSGGVMSISLSQVPVNQMELPEPASSHYPALMEEDRTHWTKAQAEEYYGLDLDVLSVPVGMEAVADLSGGMDVWINQDGSMRFDGLLLRYEKDSGEYPSGTCPSLTLRASKIGLLEASLPVYETDTVQTWEFQGTQITVGLCQPEVYDETGASTESYPVYVLSFTYQGAQFQLEGVRTDLAEMVRAAATLLSGEESVEVKP